jgi:hypothetical protein
MGYVAAIIREVVDFFPVENRIILNCKDAKGILIYM